MSRLSRLAIIFALLILTALGNVHPAAASERQPARTAVFVDTDIGVDDAIAIAWLIDQRDVNLVGFSTVFGNTTVENATRNLITLFNTAGVHYPIAIGAAAPSVFPRTRTGSFVHGPDGFWFAQRPADISKLPTDAPAAIAAAARANRSTIFIALGPLTNFAQAMKRFPADMSGVRLVALAGGKHGNSTPVAEFNVYADPQALETVLAGSMKVELVTIDAFEQVKVDSTEFAKELTKDGGPVGKLLGGILPYYAQASTSGLSSTISLPDAAAAVYALNAKLGTPTSALVRVATDTGYTRGQTIIADTLSGRIALNSNDEEMSTLAEQSFIPGFDVNASIYSILMRQADNAQVVLDVREGRVVSLIEHSLLR